MTAPISSDLPIPSSDDTLASIVESIYPKLLENMSDITYFKNIVILAPRNSIVKQINNYMLDLVQAKKKLIRAINGGVRKKNSGVRLK